MGCEFSPFSRSDIAPHLASFTTRPIAENCRLPFSISQRRPPLTSFYGSLPCLLLRLPSFACRCFWNLIGALTQLDLCAFCHTLSTAVVFSESAVTNASWEHGAEQIIP